MIEQDIFVEAMSRPDEAERRHFVDQACGDDETLRARLEKLIRHAGGLGSFLEHPPEPLAMTATAMIDAEVVGTEIGPYKLLELLGEGGFGVVFLAEQEKPVRRKVALKVIKPGMDTREVIARFEAERQALALMDHPNIAKVLDAGTTIPLPSPSEKGAGGEGVPEHAPVRPPASSLQSPASRPFFVMELVQGVPITEYCDQCQLTTRERLELFVTVCQAVQHAHQKGIIHRDLKPTNVLVAIQDGQPAPKIIDFGVAKAIGEHTLTERTLTTAFAQMIGSPMYMSPEQAELSPLGVDTRSDIYSLGVMLYELLAGSTPFDKDRLHAASYDELRRIIREEEPPRPSARISSLSLRERAGVRETANQATTIAERRRTDPRRLIQAIRGELDWIVMKCLDKDRNRRYESAGGLARDVERFLADEPVHACPPSASYRIRKFARRNKAMLASGGAIAAALIVGLTLSTLMYVRAATERARYQAVNDFMQWTLASSSPDADELKAALRRGISVNDALGDAPLRPQAHELQQYDKAFEGPPAAEAELAASYAWLATVLATDGRRDEAEAVARRAVDHLAHAATNNLPPQVHLTALYYLALAQLRLGNHAGYRDVCTEMLQVPIEHDDDRRLVLWSWCLGPHPSEDLSVQLKQADELVANHAANNYAGSFSAPSIDLGMLGGLLYRAGLLEQAAQRLEESIAAYADDALSDFRTSRDLQYILAMTKWRLGQRDQARRLLAETQLTIDEWLQTPSKNTWQRRSEIEVLRREAEALIEPK